MSEWKSFLTAPETVASESQEIVGSVEAAGGNEQEANEDVGGVGASQALVEVSSAVAAPPAGVFFLI